MEAAAACLENLSLASAERSEIEYFSVTYEIEADTEGLARRKAETVALEQTIEGPISMVKGTPLEQEVLGKVRSIRPRDENANTTSACVWTAVIDYPVEDVGGELPQFLNLVYGLACLHAHVRLVDFEMSPSLVEVFPGPRFGIEGLRKLCGAPQGPLLCAVLKPVGRSVNELAEYAYSFAKGGMDVIKDDDSLQNQKWAPFEERVAAVAAAVRQANRETGRNCLYAPCLNAPITKFMDRARFAKAAGAGAVLCLPGISGFDCIHALSIDENFGLPIICHPAFMGMTGGSTTPGTATHGLSHRVEFGRIPRMAGADVTIYPNSGGAFDISKEECLSIRRAAAEPGFGGCRPMFPSPSGGITVDAAGKLFHDYGDNVFLVMGTSLYTAGPDIQENAWRVASKLHRSFCTPED